MLAEGMHSLADVANQLLLKQGVVRSRRQPTREHQYGFHREKYVYALISGGWALGGAWVGEEAPDGLRGLARALLACSASISFDGAPRLPSINDPAARPPARLPACRSRLRVLRGLRRLGAARREQPAQPARAGAHGLQPGGAGRVGAAGGLLAEHRAADHPALRGAGGHGRVAVHPARQGAHHCW